MTPVSILAVDLHACAPSLSPERCEEYAPFLSAAMSEGDITAPWRATCFIAQILHESIDLHAWLELDNFSGERERYKGRGPLQLTWKRNYEACGKHLGLPLVEHPELLCEPGPGFRSAVWYWSANKLNRFADRIEQLCAEPRNLSLARGAYDSLSRAINGQSATENSLNDRWRRFLHCFPTMNIPTIVAPAV